MGSAYIFAVRAPSRRTHDRLVVAARHDAVCINEELEMLLDLREQWAVLTSPKHSLGRPAPIPATGHLPCCVAAQRALTVPEDGKMEGIDYWYGTAFRTRYKEELRLSRLGAVS